MTLRQRQPRQRDEAHLAWLRTLPSLVPGLEPVEGAHVRYSDLDQFKRPTGLGEKPGDRYAVPLAGDRHREQHAGNERVFWERHGVDPLVIAKELWWATGDDTAGRTIVRTAKARSRMVAIPETVFLFLRGQEIEGWCIDEDDLFSALAEVGIDDAGSVLVRRVSRTGEQTTDVTLQVARTWSEHFDLHAGEDESEILARFPPFVREHLAEELMEVYSAAEQQADDERFDRAPPGRVSVRRK